MNNKKIVCIVFFLLLAVLLFSQQGYNVQQKNDDGLYLFSWPAVENATRYVLRLQREGAQPIDIVTKDTQAEYTLEMANYRFQVTAYTLLSETVMPWSSLAATARPRIYSFSPISTDQNDGQIELVITGKNILRGSELTLVSKNGSVSSRSFTVNAEGTQARVLFNAQDLSKDKYTLRIKNPDGLEDSVETFYAGNRKIHLLLGYAPVVPLHGSWFETFELPVYPLGAELRGSYYFLSDSWGDLGAEGVLAWNYLFANKNKAEITAHLFGLTANILYRKELKSGVYVKTRAGLGITSVLGLKIDYFISKADAYNYFYLMAALGASIEWDLKGPFYLESGLDYNLIFSKKNQGYIRPFVGLGWRL